MLIAIIDNNIIFDYVIILTYNEYNNIQHIKASHKHNVTTL